MTAAASGEKPVPLARFRADPGKVQVRIRRTHAGRAWAVFINPRSRPWGRKGVVGVSTDPRRALGLALNEAVKRGLPGIDLELAGLYPHPHGVAGIAARVPE